MNSIFKRVSVRSFQERPVESEQLEAFAIIPVGYPVKETPQQDRFDQSRIHYVK